MTDIFARIAQRESDEFQADWDRRARERAADPHRAEKLRIREEQARAARDRFGHRPLAVQEAADRAERKSAGVYEPNKAEVAEMRSAQYLSEITDFCRNFRGERDELKEQLNHAFMVGGIGLKVIRWKWAGQ